MGIKAFYHVVCIYLTAQTNSLREELQRLACEQFAADGVEEYAMDEGEVDQFGGVNSFIDLEKERLWGLSNEG